MAEDWYERRSELEPGMVFLAYDGSVVRLDRSVPGDGTKWYAEDWHRGWASYDSTYEPGDLVVKLPKDYAGENVSHLMPKDNGWGYEGP